MRTVYTKGRARVLLWEEEIQLLCEEMRRVLVFMLWKRDWWLERADLRADARVDIRSGLKAYAARQAAVFGGLALQFATLWRPALGSMGMQVEWPAELIDATSHIPIPLNNPNRTRAVDGDEEEEVVGGDQRAEGDDSEHDSEDLELPEEAVLPESDGGDDSDYA